MSRDSSPVMHYRVPRNKKKVACGREVSGVWFYTKEFHKVTCTLCISRTPSRLKP